MDLIEGSETSEIINQTPGNYPKESLLYFSQIMTFQRPKHVAVLKYIYIYMSIVIYLILYSLFTLH